MSRRIATEPKKQVENGALYRVQQRKNFEVEKYVSNPTGDGKDKSTRRRQGRSANGDGKASNGDGNS